MGGSMTRILFVAHVSLGWQKNVIRQFKYKANCAIICPSNLDIASEPGVEHFYFRKHRGIGLGFFGYVARLEKAFCAFQPDIIVPLDDVSAWTLRGIRCGGRLFEVLDKSLGYRDFYRIVNNRQEFSCFSRMMGFNVPHSVTENEPVDFPSIMKENQSTGGFGVGYVRNTKDVERFPWRKGIIYNLKRSFRRKLLQKSGSLASIDYKYQIQEIIPGPVYGHVAFALDGKTICQTAFAIIRNSYIEEFGISNQQAIIMSKITQRKIYSMAENLISNLKMSGFIHLEFIGEPNNIHVLECNPRLTAKPFTTEDGASFVDQVLAAL
jgi:hypothetical protein